MDSIVNYRDLWIRQKTSNTGGGKLRSNVTTKARKLENKDAEN